MPDTTLDRHADQVHAQALAAAEAVYALTHQTLLRHPLPAPEVYRTLAELERLTFGLNQALRQLGQTLQASLRAYDVYDEPGADPRTSVDNACEYLDDAANYSLVAGQTIAAARTQIAGQGHHGLAVKENR